MPFYDYGCRECGTEFETFHAIAESPVVPCPECLSENTRKLVSACGIIVHSTGAKSRVLDHVKREQEARTDLRENYGVENVHPMQGSSFASVYNDIKNRGSFVRDRMQCEAEQSEQKRAAKRKEWVKAANRRVPERLRVRKDKKAQQDAASRAIRLAT